MFSREALLRGSSDEQRPVVAVAVAPTDRAISTSPSIGRGQDAQQVRIPFPITQIEQWPDDLHAEPAGWWRQLAGTDLRLHRHVRTTALRQRRRIRLVDCR